MFPFYVHLEKTASEYKFVLEAEGFWIDGVLVPSPKTLGFVLVLSISDKCCSDFPQLPRLLLFFKTKVKKKKKKFHEGVSAYICEDLSTFPQSPGDRTPSYYR